MTRQTIIDALWHGRDPFANPPEALRALDLQGWRSIHPYLEEAVREWRPGTVVEIGAWKGASVLYLARTMAEHAVSGTVIAVDTWLGAVDHWADPALFAELSPEHGYPSLYRTFLANVLHEGMAERVVPLPLDSVNAAELMRLRGLSADVIHLDAGHEESSVAADLRAWWPVLRPGGLFIADDYDSQGGKFPGVARAVDAFCAEHGLAGPWSLRGKAKFVKPLDAA
ncbi:MULTISPECIES: class I SAM-dependent methyltransferase [Methylobacterium]|jgi:predicted O-methyltransferase YrrM|uniref:class I SAM-dependent methyltransferase n=1 Tax=Methylobacterium TaxID=407 RepID=UPI0008E0E7DA|nr:MULTISPECIES: class I SAM-dependent methyltransferase [Methylobacterium]MBZ6413943.1 class I SAM-dependent methyltransferase [Methylobacterium sp.]MBK3400896.1 class I SAM-dependent methyltransferase [Methylobacterium ajmalii]MBK3410694.1 class I SAM-dependent methyltransferase [Methylobacterium ajmalii]MBK3421749.1 class I SAM-dependent methyltransferase [Methylobacterium ajmalii]SFF57595.1 Methyltransferase domain-containing protein [Methylobacterium sp. yr596]